MYMLKNSQLDVKNSFAQVKISYYHFSTFRIPVLRCHRNLLQLPRGRGQILMFYHFVNLGKNLSVLEKRIKLHEMKLQTFSDIIAKFDFI